MLANYNVTMLDKEELIHKEESCAVLANYNVRQGRVTMCCAC